MSNHLDPQTAKPQRNRRKFVHYLLATTLYRGMHVVSGWGLILIVYGIVVKQTGKVWEPLEVWIHIASTVLTILSTVLTAASVYWYSPQPHPPEMWSRWASAPIVIVAAVIALWVLWQYRELPIHITTGFALLGLGGAWFRIQAPPPPWVLEKEAPPGVQAG